MKNKEFYRDEIIQCEQDDFCRHFTIPKILEPMGMDCDKIPCEQCYMISAIWLDSECEEPEVDWSKVPVDMPIRVSNDKESWLNRYFAKYRDGIVYTWGGGTTSWSCRDGCEYHDCDNCECQDYWLHAKLAEAKND